MTKNKIFSFLLFIFFINLSISKDIHPKAGTTGMAFLKLPVGARSIAMGEAFTSVVSDVNSIYWNSAGLVYLKSGFASFTHNEWLEDIRYGFIGYAEPLEQGKSSVGISFTYLSSGNILKTTLEDPSGEYSGIYTAKDMAISFAYARAFNPNFSIGLNTKYLYQQIDLEKANGLACDLGILYKDLYQDKINLSAVIQNIGQMSDFIEGKQILPTKYILGCSYKIFNTQKNSLNLVVDIIKPIDNYFKINLGTEYWFHQLVALRLGYKINSDLNALTCGGGLRIGIEEKNIYIDYAFVGYKLFNNTHRFSLGFEF
ncbi:MAG: PorV/PorQ family protein [bacterium]